MRFWRTGASRAARLRDVVTRFLAPSPVHPLRRLTSGEIAFYPPEVVPLLTRL